PGSDVFELMERQNEVEDEPEMKDEIEVKDEPEVEDDVDDETVIDDDDEIEIELEEELEEEGTIILNEAARPDWYDWEVDYPASYVDDVYRAISFNDRYEFIKELFNISGDLSEAEVLFKDTLDDINEMENFKQVVGYIRHRFPQWDEQSDEVYRFYMAIRRKFNRE
ncbi:MAG: hypothetical protein IKY70_03900, partial [Bacteroidales bacterium]|nr:hypothetical protein [Bacteroidales bacterium]